MIKLQRSSITLAILLKSPEYCSLLYPGLIKNNQYLLSPSTYAVITEAYSDQELVGLCVAEVYPLHHTAQILSFMIRESHRNQGMGKLLFAFTQDLLIQHEPIETLELTYEQNEPFTLFLEKILISLGWNAPSICLLRCYFDCLNFNPFWFQRDYSLPASFTIFSWQDLNSDEREFINYLEQQGRFVPYLSPFINEELIDLKLSLGLREKGRVVGWCVVHRLDTHTVRYASFYIDSHLIQKGYSIQLLKEVIIRQKKAQVPDALFEINFREIDPSWLHFLKKRLFPLAENIKLIKTASRTFKTYLE